MVKPHDLASDERLAESHLVGDKCPAHVADQPQGAGDAVGLEAGERKPPVLLLQLADLGAVELEQNAQEDLIRREGRENLLVERRQVDRIGLVPQRIEPGAGLLDDRIVVSSEIELQVAVEATICEVGRARNDACAAAVDMGGGAKMYALACMKARS
jgi:hypothetical protein